MAIDISEYKKPWVASLYRTDKLEPLGTAKKILQFARSQVLKQAPNVKHPLVCIDVVEEGIISGPRAGLLKVLLFVWLHFASFYWFLLQKLLSQVA